MNNGLLIKRKPLQAVLLELCRTKFEYDCGIPENEVFNSRFGIPPVTMLIHVGPAQKDDDRLDWKLRAREADAFVYSSGVLKQASLRRRSSKEESGMYFKEAYAEAGFDQAGKAFVLMVYGKLYARCYEYDVVPTGDSYALTNEKLLWIS